MRCWPGYFHCAPVPGSLSQLSEAQSRTAITRCADPWRSSSRFASQAPRATRLPKPTQPTVCQKCPTVGTKALFDLDLTRTLFGEIGPNFHEIWQHLAFASWIGPRKVDCRAATALRMAAQSLHDSKSALGDFYCRMRAKPGVPKGITAAAQNSPGSSPPDHHRPGIRRQSFRHRLVALSEASGDQNTRESQS
jgi:hypothetical protein